jgi:hypothetical protein
MNSKLFLGRGKINEKKHWLYTLSSNR